MCLILFSYLQHDTYKLILAANRDEFYERPTQPARPWPEKEGVIAGKDLKAGGTWMGVQQNGRFAALTNFRDPAHERNGVVSRGKLVIDFFDGKMPPADYLAYVSQQAEEYNGFNLLVGDTNGFYHYSNRDNNITPVGPGVHGLSNHLLNTPWPKVERGKARLLQLTQNGEIDQEIYFSMLRDKTRAPDHTLPATGVPLEWERILSSMFIHSPGYGTRCSTLLTITHDGAVDFWERTYPTDGSPPSTVFYSF